MCAEYNRPNGVAFSLQVCRYKVEPAVPNYAFNLFPKADDRLALADEIEPDGPQVAVVCCSCSFSSSAERLAWATACPNTAIIRPSGLT